MTTTPALPMAWASLEAALRQRRRSASPITASNGALHRLEAAGLLRSEWEHGGRSAPARRVYMLTAEGQVELASCAARAAGLAVILRRYGSRYQALLKQADKSPKG